MKNFLIKHKRSILIFIKAFFIALTIGSDPLSYLVPVDDVAIPIIGFLFSITQTIDGFGIEPICLFLLSLILLSRTESNEGQKSTWLNIACYLLSVFTVLGISFMETSSWDYIFYGKQQFLVSFLVSIGYFLLYKNIVLVCLTFIRTHQCFARSSIQNPFEKLLFVTHPFGGPFVFFLCAGLPWLIMFWPGTLQWDAHAQLWQYFGVVELTGHHPLTPTLFMGACVNFGRNILHSENLGFFLYTGLQFLAQCSVFSYALFLCSRTNIPILHRWILLVFYGIYPLFPNWGVTMVKDTGYYLFFTLFILSWIDILSTGLCKRTSYKLILWLTSCIGIGLWRNDGRYIVCITLLMSLLLLRKHWKIYILGIASCLLSVFIVTDIYMPTHGIPDGAVREALCVPMLQSVKYTVDYRDELSATERSVMETTFDTAIENLPSSYNPENADGIKELFKYDISQEELQNFIRTWINMGLKHPSNYLETYLSHAYGYFYPNRNNQYGDIGIFYLGNAQHRHDEGINVWFAIPWKEGRDFLEQSVRLIERIPILGMLYSPGIYVWILIGLFFYIFHKRTYKKIVILIPSILTVGICTLSPLNACVRYILPIAAVTPILVLYSIYFSNNSESSEA